MPRKPHDRELAPRVLLLLATEPPMKPGEVAQRLGMTEAHQRRAVVWCLQNLRNRGLLRSRGEGKPGLYETVVADHPGRADGDASAAHLYAAWGIRRPGRRGSEAKGQRWNGTHFSNEPR